MKGNKINKIYFAFSLLMFWKANKNILIWKVITKYDGLLKDLRGLYMWIEKMEIGQRM